MIAHGTSLSLLQESPQRRAATALKAYKSNHYIRGAERAIVNRISTVPWWLEDAQGERVTDESPDELRGIGELLDRPYRPQPGDPVVATPKTFDELRSLTIRHMGLVGYGFWYLVGVETLGFPLEVLYINPTRLVPATNKAGELIGWVLDPDAAGRGTPLSIAEVVPFYLEPPEDGFLSDGLVTTARTKIELLRLADTHVGQILASGGRIPGMLTPKEGAMPEEAYQGLVRDLRSIMEDPNAAKRTLVLKAPVDFEGTAMDLDDMKTLELMTMNGDDILSLWGVPRSQLGYPRKFSLGGTADDMDAEAMWNNAAGPRAAGFYDTLQREVLDRYENGITVHIEAPEFDDRLPLFEMAQKAAAIPMRNVERRDLIGLPPLGDPALDDQILLPINVVPVEQAPEFDPGDRVKARLDSTKEVVRLKDALTGFLTEQAERIGRKLEDKSGHVASKPKDDSVWWNQDKEDKALQKVLRPHVVMFAEQGASRAFTKVRGKALDAAFSETLEAQTLRRLASRVTNINKTTRDRIRSLVIDGLAADLSPSEMGRALRGVVKPLEGDAAGNELRRRLGDFGSELRAETIARTEMRVAQNGATLDAYQSDGIERVEMIDGDGDPACSARNGEVVTLSEALQHMDEEHPNGTLDFAPIVRGKAETFGGTSEDRTAPFVQHIHYPPPVQDVHYTPPEVHIPATNVTVPKPDPVNVEVHTPAPVVNIAPAEAPTINMAAPDVTVETAPLDLTPVAKAISDGEKRREKAAGDPQPVYVTNMPGPRTAKVKRDRKGRITEVTPQDS